MSSPKAAFASARAMASAEGSSLSARTTFMPRPPPPAAALSMTGKPMSRAKRRASSSEPTPPSEPGTVGMPSSFGGALGRDLVAHQADMFGPGTDELHVVLGENFGEAGVLGEEPIARMHGVGAGDLAGREQRRNVEVAVLGGRRTDADALVGEPHVHGVLVRGRMHGHRRDAELLARAQDAERISPRLAIRNFRQNKSHSMIISGSPYSTGWPSSIKIWMTVPERGAGI